MYSENSPSLEEALSSTNYSPLINSSKTALPFSLAAASWSFASNISAGLSVDLNAISHSFNGLIRAPASRYGSSVAVLGVEVLIASAPAPKSGSLGLEALMSVVP